MILITTFPNLLYNFIPPQKSVQTNENYNTICFLHRVRVCLATLVDMDMASYSTKDNIMSFPKPLSIIFEVSKLLCCFGLAKIDWGLPSSSLS